MRERGQFLLDYIDLLLHEGEGEAEDSVTSRRSTARATRRATMSAARGRDRWVVNKVRALGTWYTKGFENGSHLRIAINQCDSIGRLREIVETFFFEGPRVRRAEDKRGVSRRGGNGPPAPWRLKAEIGRTGLERTPAFAIEATLQIEEPFRERVFVVELLGQHGALRYQIPNSYPGPS